MATYRGYYYSKFSPVPSVPKLSNGCGRASIERVKLPDTPLSELLNSRYAQINVKKTNSHYLDFVKKDLVVFRFPAMWFSQAQK